MLFGVDGAVMSWGMSGGCASVAYGCVGGYGGGIGVGYAVVMMVSVADLGVWEASPRHDG